MSQAGVSAAPSSPPSTFPRRHFHREPAPALPAADAGSVGRRDFGAGALRRAAYSCHAVTSVSAMTWNVGPAVVASSLSLRRRTASGRRLPQMRQRSARSSAFLAPHAAHLTFVTPKIPDLGVPVPGSHRHLARRFKEAANLFS